MKTMKNSILTVLMALALGSTANATQSCNTEGEMDQCRYTPNQSTGLYAGGVGSQADCNDGSCFKNMVGGDTTGREGFQASGSTVLPSKAGGAVDGAKNP